MGRVDDGNVRPQVLHTQAHGSYRTVVGGTQVRTSSQLPGSPRSPDTLRCLRGHRQRLSPSTTLNAQSRKKGGLTDEHRADSEGDTLGVDVGLVQVVEHAVEGRHRAVLVGNDGEVDVAGAGRAGEGVNVLDPALVAGDIVGRETNELLMSAPILHAANGCHAARRRYRSCQNGLTLTPREAKSPAERATAESSVVQTGV